MGRRRYALSLPLAYPPARLSPAYWRSPLLVGLAVAAVITGVAAAGVDPPWGSDLAAFLASGRALLAGADPYGPALWAPATPGGMILPNMNPPLWLPLFAVLGTVAPPVALIGLGAVSLALFGLMLAALARAYPAQTTPERLGWALCLGALWHTLIIGQVYVLVGAVAVAAWLLLRRQRWVAAGLALGLLVALKPNLLVWPALLLVAGYRRPGLWAIGGGAVIALAPLLVYGPGVYPQWLTVAVLASSQGVHNNLALAGLLARLGGPAGPGQVAVVGLLTALALIVWRRRPGVAAVSELALVAALLAGPITWVGNTLVLLPLFWRRAHWSPGLTAAALLLTFPGLALLAAAEGLGVSWLTVGTLSALLLAWLLGMALRDALRYPADETIETSRVDAVHVVHPSSRASRHPDAL